MNDRENIGVKISIISILINITLATTKLIFGYLTHSISVQADAINNYSDVGSNIASLFGFKLALKSPDEHHPYGHGRIEYISGLFIAFLILYVALNSFKESITKIIHPASLNITVAVFIALIISCLGKAVLMFLNKRASKRIQSVTLEAAYYDSRNDILMTSATILSLVVEYFCHLHVDGIVGSVVSLFVLKSGVEIMMNTINPLLGESPDPKLIQEIENFVEQDELVLGVHDIMIHDYGPGRTFGSLHVEISKKNDLMIVHDHIDEIEREIKEKYHISFTIHIDPFDLHDKTFLALYKQIKNVLQKRNQELSLHDLRIIDDLISFDILIPSSFNEDIDELKESLIQEIHTNYPDKKIEIGIDYRFY